MKKDNYINRREFLKITGATALTTSAALTGCAPTGQADPGALGPVPTDKMTYRTLPSLRDTVSLLGYGCMRWPTMPNPNGQGMIINQEVVNELVDYAIAHGVNYFDTAPVYVMGQSERATGIALSRYPREKYFIATKMSNPANPDFNASVDMYRKSMEQLQVDYFDYYLLHNLGSVGNRGYDYRFLNNGLLDFLLKEREAGRIRHLGWSFHGIVEQFDRVLSDHERVHWDFVQIQMNYSDWENAATGRNVNADYMYKELSKRNIPVVVMEPLLGGRLSNLPVHIVSLLKAQNPGGSAASWAFRFAGSFDNVLTVLSGMTYMEHLQDNIRTYSPLVALDDSQKQFLYDTAELMLQYPTIPCNDCMYCMPCPYGIDIPGILLHYNKCVNDGNLPKSSNNPDYRKARRAYLVSYERTVEKIRQADHCTGCKKCNEECPQKIDIPTELRKLNRFIEQLKQETFVGA
ncbi:MAG: aldo/keto reductase [Tannerella sp.]|jgi:predicted aldo/keto reductase-like oxidoreductase|nr:aldo/keto reductase [Tannerella sp.]